MTSPVGDEDRPASPKPRKRKRAAEDGPTGRRSTSACVRCKTKKLKCHYSAGEVRICAPCVKARADCAFDLAPDGIPRGADYIHALETRIALLEDCTRTAPNVIPLATASAADNADAVGNNFSSWSVPLKSLTIWNIAECGSQTFSADYGPLPSLPAPDAADKLLENAYLYTQARYCIVDWVKIRQWHGDRERFCYSSPSDDISTTTGAYFLWMTYAIGAQLRAPSESCSKGYYARALQYLRAPLVSKDLTAVQALLMMANYSYRSSPGPSQWSIVGAVMRLCVELGLHRKASSTSALDLYTIELQKRFFWCAYSFDRLISLIADRPFGINDLDIDVDVPFDVDVECTNENTLRALQTQQENSESRSATVTSISASLHLLQMYRLRSRIKSFFSMHVMCVPELISSHRTHFYGPHAMPPSHTDVIRLMNELEQWRHQTPAIPSTSTYPRIDQQDTHAVYLQASLFIFSPMLRLNVVQPDLLYKSAVLSLEGCETTKLLCFNPNHEATTIKAFICFTFGVTFLRCLVIIRDILPMSQVWKAISACNGALAVYSRTLDTAVPFLQVFDRLCDRFFGVAENDTRSWAALRDLLYQISSCGPDRVSDFILRLSDQEALASEWQSSDTPGQNAPPTPSTIHSSGQQVFDVLDMSNQPSMAFACENGSLFPLENLTMPFEIFANALPGS